MRSKGKERTPKYVKETYTFKLSETDKLDRFIPDKLENPENEIVQIIFKVENPALEHGTYLSKVVSNRNIGSVYEYSDMMSIEEGEGLFYEYCVNNTIGLSRYQGYNIQAVEVAVFSLNK